MLFPYLNDGKELNQYTKNTRNIRSFYCPSDLNPWTGMGSSGTNKYADLEVSYGLVDLYYFKLKSFPIIGSGGLSQPSKTAAYMDCQKDLLVYPPDHFAHNTYPLVYRHNNRNNVLFWDFHASSYKQSEMPMKADTFWTGD
jgi:prepilin-type processing-associated H-X9-DG protein